MLLPVILVLLAYLIGSIPFGFIVARARGVDITKAGSGNIGATNVGRVLGRKYGILVFALDVLKGAVPTALMSAFSSEGSWSVATGLAAILGHLFPVYLRFRGGKGVATGFGVVAVLLPIPAAIAFLVWLLVVATTRYVSLASVIAAIVLAAVRLTTAPAPFSTEAWPISVFCVATALLVIVKHRDNISRLLQGKENRVADSPQLHCLSRVLHVLALGLWCGGGIMFSLIVAPSLFSTFDARTAGQAVAPIFPFYFALQGVCGLVAVATAAKWASGGRVHAWRFFIITLAVALVMVGWPLAAQVSELRAQRYSLDPAIAESANAMFGRWHIASLLLNLTVIGLTVVALSLAAAMPTPRINDEHDSL
jgi:acyl-phosphate glycerol 3-phosphate acyltransferase